MLPRHQEELVGLGAARAALPDRLFLAGQQLQLHRGDDRLRNLVLQREDVVEVAVVALRPQVAAGRAVDQLRGDAHALAGLAHAALEHVADPELPRELPDVDVLALERERRVARGDRERGDLAEVGDDVFADAVAEILLLRLAAHVGEGQHADREPRRGLPRPRRAQQRCRPFVAATLTGDRRLERAQQLLAWPAGGIAAPAVEIGRVDRAHVERQAGRVESGRDQDAAIGRLARLAAHPARRDRRRRPDHDDRAGLGEFGGDLVVEFLAGGDCPDPTRRPPLWPRWRRRAVRRALCRCGRRRRRHRPCGANSSRDAGSALSGARNRRMKLRPGAARSTLAAERPLTQKAAYYRLKVEARGSGE